MQHIGVRAKIDLAIMIVHQKSNHFTHWYTLQWTHFFNRGRRGHEGMVVGFTTTYAISAYHHWCYECEFRSGWGVQHYVIKFVSDLCQVGGFLRVLRFPPPMKLTATYNWNIVESCVKHHQTNKQTNQTIFVECKCSWF